MKKLFSFLVLSISLIGAAFCDSSADKEGYKVECKIKGVEEGAKIQLGYHSGEKKRLQDTAFVKNGVFTFEREEALPRGVYLVIVPGMGYFDLIMGDDQHFSLSADTIGGSGFIPSMKIKGSEENVEFYKLLNKTQPLKIEIQKKTQTFTKDSCSGNEKSGTCFNLKKDVLRLKDEVKEIEEEYIKTHPDYLSAKMINILHDIFVPEYLDEPNETKRKAKRYYYYKKYYLSHVDFNEPGLVRSPVFVGKIDQYFDNVVQKSCDSTTAEIEMILGKASSKEMYQYLLVHLATKYQKSKIMCFDCIQLHLFKNHYLKDSRVDWLSEDQKKSITEETWKLDHNQCGDVAFPMTLPDTNNVMHDVLKIDADYTIVYFWSATCGHCKKATPKLQKMYNEVKDKYNLEVYSVCIDRERGEFDKFVQKYQFDWISVIDVNNTDKKYRTAYNVFSTPTIYILDKNKKIIAKKLDVEALEDFIKRYNEQK